MGHQDVDPVLAYLVGRDVGVHRAVLGERGAGHVLAQAGPKRIAEGLLVVVDEEIDRVGLGHAEQLGGVVDGLLADVEGASGQSWRCRRSSAAGRRIR